ncbi:Fe-S cluster assembly ATPase SufC [Candidatus Galacturonibacter soehngenii]|uniref:Fe-S cluster assembly ATPase SufC n=1 Tax=Candidatus Galacturonatibacter soehngenii TaxID=2307010 RepID=A0A7V7UAT1_9FIRM|nr:Fe-S cluster assembly ATPase SufC [Candidatus Galacturonibacter soehngenii]KAB1436028.1 Fe-S cluster assembly ATPase SufC [Candidatus Galacturonibacter soehngenii]
MQKNLLEIKDLKATVEGKLILNGVDLTIRPGEVHVLMGPNGAGKSTLANVIMGDPRFEVEEGNIVFEGEDISKEKPDARARKGIFLSFQAPEEIPGVTLENFLRASRAACSGKPVKIFAFKDELSENMKALGMDEAYAKRYLNVGFSGGEKKKSEILQLAMMNPKLAILDETDSGLDVDAVKLISENIARFRNENNAILIITHITKILQNLPIDYVHVLADGKIVKTGDASIVDTIVQEGFSSVLG